MYAANAGGNDQSFGTCGQEHRTPASSQWPDDLNAEIRSRDPGADIEFEIGYAVFSVVLIRGTASDFFLGQLTNM